MTTPVRFAYADISASCADGNLFVNSVGIPEIPPSVFEELLVNALVHRDYLVSAPIRLFIFDNRIDIITVVSLISN